MLIWGKMVDTKLDRLWPPDVTPFENGHVILERVLITRILYDGIDSQLIVRNAHLEEFSFSCTLDCEFNKGL